MVYHPIAYYLAFFVFGRWCNHPLKFIFSNDHRFCSLNVWLIDCRGCRILLKRVFTGFNFNVKDIEAVQTLGLLSRLCNYFLNGIFLYWVLTPTLMTRKNWSKLIIINLLTLIQFNYSFCSMNSTYLFL